MDVIGRKVGFRQQDHPLGLTTTELKLFSTGAIDPNFNTGIIGSATERDYFHFTSSGGSVSARVDAATFTRKIGLARSQVVSIANTALTLELRNRAGEKFGQASFNIAGSGDLGSSLNATIPAGDYFLVVRTQGGYGNSGQYKLSGQITPETTRVLSGRVTANGSGVPAARLEGVCVAGACPPGFSLTGIEFSTTTDSNGFYHAPIGAPGSTWLVTARRESSTDQRQFLIGSAPTTTVNFDLGGGGFGLTGGGVVTAATDQVLRVTGATGNSNDLIAIVRVGSNLHVTINGVEKVTKLSDFNSLRVDSGGGDDLVTLDFSGGDLVPSGGLVVESGSGSDSVLVRSLAGFDQIDYDQYLSGSGTVKLAGSAAYFDVENTEKVEFDGVVSNINVSSVNSSITDATINDSGVSFDTGLPEIVFESPRRLAFEAGGTLQNINVTPSVSTEIIVRGTEELTGTLTIETENTTNQVLDVFGSFGSKWSSEERSSVFIESIDNIETSHGNHELVVTNSVLSETQIADAGESLLTSNRVDASVRLRANNGRISVYRGDIDTEHFVLSDNLQRVNSIRVIGSDEDDLFTTVGDFQGFDGSFVIEGNAGNDLIQAEGSPSSLMQLLGGAGDDVFRVGGPNLSDIRGGIFIDGGEHDTTRTETQVISVNGEVVEREKTTGDRLEVFGDDAEATATISVTGSSISVSSHAGAIDFTRIETVSIQNAVAGNPVRIEGTNANQNVTVFGGDAADRVTVADTGENSFVDILVGAGDDNIDILQTGMGSSLYIWTYDGNDEVTVFSSGSNSSINIETGIGNDRPWIQDTGENSLLRIATDDGDDALILNGTGVGSRTEYFAGAGNERVLVSSVSDHTTYIKGDVWLHGEEDGPEGSSARLADGLEFYFSAPSGQQNLRLDANTFQRVESDVSGVISYDGWESIFVYGSESKEILTVAGMAAGGFVDVRLVGGDDELTIESTGENSLLSVATGGGVDIVDVVSTGEGSRLQIYTEVSVDEYDLPFGDETVTLRNSGMNSRVGIVTGRGSDTVTVLTTGLGSETEISTEQSSDLIDLRGSGAGSTTRVIAGEANDRIIISSDTDGEYMLGGSFYIYGGEHSEAPTTEVSINARGVVVSNFYSEGDTLDLFFNGTSESRDYRLADSVFERTDDVGTGTIFFDGIESLNVTTGSGDDSFVVNNTATHSSVDLRLNGGDDEVVVESTGEDSLLYVETDDGSDQVSVRSTGARSLLRVFTYETVDGDGDDRISILGTGVGSGVEVGTGSGADVFSIEATGRNSVLIAILGEGDDIVNIYTVDGALSIRASEGNDTVNLYFPSIGVRDTGFILSKFGALLHGDEGTDKLVLHGDQGTFNISDPLLNIAGFDDFQNVVEIGSPVGIDAEMVKAIAPDSGELVVKGDVAGGVVVKDFDLWRMTKPAIRDGHFFLRARYIGTSPTELIIAIIVDRPWQNVLIPEDVNGDGKVSALDALNVINELNIEFYSSAAQLSDPIAVANWPGLYFDSTGDGRVTALDALVIINRLNLMDSVGAGEAISSTTDLMPQAFLVSTKESVVNRVLQLNTEWKNIGVGKRIQAIDGSKDSMPASSFANVTIIPDERDPATNRAVDELLSDLGFVDSLLET